MNWPTYEELRVAALQGDQGDVLCEGTHGDKKIIVGIDYYNEPFVRIYLSFEGHTLFLRMFSIADDLWIEKAEEYCRNIEYDDLISHTESRLLRSMVGRYMQQCLTEDFEDTAVKLCRLMVREENSDWYAIIEDAILKTAQGRSLHFLETIRIAEKLL